ncbi:tripartite tricarboxylate transporter substrate binding protein [Variovorax paradoxus]|nr:tripartite tricarboxylate transporter substrate binding protein [Variovorax paradoxus]MBT2305208.1 tripartite tricarboxylate transporter substrate binding protein [Variovorax paradoxus]
MTTIRFILCAAFALAFAAPVSSWADFPDKPVRVIVPFAPGSLTDVVFRSLAMEMERDLGQTVVIDNKAGASGIIGTQAAVTAPPDGYTLVSVGVTNGASNKSLFKKLPYDPSKDFTPIGLVSETPFLLVVNAESPIKNLRELFAKARAEPDSIRYAYASGSAQVAGAKLASAGGVKFPLVSYKSSPQILTEIIGGVVETTLSDFAGGMALVRAGKLRALGVTTKQRFALAPDLPTLAEAGAPGYDVVVWFGLVGPAGMPKAVQERLSVALNKALNSAAVKERFERQGITPRPSTPGEFQEFLDKEIKIWKVMIDEAGLKAE